MGWFYGFKLHLAINEKGEVLDVALTPGNIEDRKPLRKFAERLHGSLYADRGYISKDLREAPRRARRELGLQSPKEHETPTLIGVR